MMTSSLWTDGIRSPAPRKARLAKVLASSDRQVVEGNRETATLRCCAHGAGQSLVIGREIGDGRQLELAAVDAVADLDAVAAAAQQQAELPGGLRQFGQGPARVIERDDGADAQPAVEILDAGLEP